MFFKPEYILILAFISVVTYFTGIKIEASKDHKKKKQYLIASIIATIAILVFFKYYNFINGNITGFVKLFGWNNPIPYLEILLPLGLSFYTFQAMSYSIELYRNNQKAEKHFGIYSLYLAFFPKLVAGPIERPQNLLPQFRERHAFSWLNLLTGWRLMAWGFFKKLVIADRLAIYVNDIYYDPANHHWLNLVLAAVFFALQLYFDFSGYSDIAIGAAKTMGFDLMQNFNAPYFARSVSEFWRRWHISLSTWVNDYLYTPLTISTRDYGKAGLVFSLLVAFLVIGLWHGAHWNFIIFGLLQGVVLSYEALTKKLRKSISNKVSPLLYNSFSILLVFLFWCFSLIFFRANSVNEATEIVQNIFTFNSNFQFSHVIIQANYVQFGAVSLFIVLIAGALVFFIEKNLKYDLTNLNDRKKQLADILFTTACVASIFTLGVFQKSSFIYIQF
jgi:D-alanyl-lipoteichoic acid acyltransferase DltB (MBOAT superfamily)